MGIFKDLSGCKYGRLQVLCIDGKYRGAYRWKCQCDCGLTISVPGYHLTSGHTISCGCYNRFVVGERNRKPDGEAAKNRAYGYLIKSARARGYVVELTKEQFLELSQQPCFYCGCMPDNSNLCKGKHGDFAYNGMDRLDNTKGYSKENCVPCCKSCNTMKGDITPNMLCELYAIRRERGYIQDELSVIEGY